MNNIKTPEELYEYMSINITYGYIDKNNEYNYYIDDDYHLLSPEEFERCKVGICWDQVEFERKFFEDHNYKFGTYSIVHYTENKCPDHTFLIYEDNNKFYWFENSWTPYVGIHEYNTLLEALTDIRTKFIEHDLNNEYVPRNLCIFKYDKPKYGLSISEFYAHWEQGENIRIG